MRKFLRLISIQFFPVSFHRLEVFVGRHLGIELDRHGGVFLQITIEILDIDKYYPCAVRECIEIGQLYHTLY